MPSTTSTPEHHNDPNGSLIDNLRLAIIIIALFILAIVLSLSIIGLYRRRQARARNNVNLELDDVRRGAAYTGDGRRWYGNRRADRDANSRTASATMSRILARFKPQPQRDRERMRMDSVTGTRASAAENHELQTLQQSSNRRIWPGAQPHTPFQGQNLYNERLENPFRVRTTNAVLSQTLLQDEATQSAHQSQNRDPLLPSYAECTRQQTAIHGPNGRADMVGQSLESIMEPRGVELQAVQPHPR